MKDAITVMDGSTTGGKVDPCWSESGQNCFRVRIRTKRHILNFMFDTDAMANSFMVFMDMYPPAVDVMPQP